MNVVLKSVCFVSLVICSANLQGFARDQTVSTPKSKAERDAELAYNRARMTDSRGTGALKYYNEAIRLNPKYADAYMARSIYYYGKNELKLQKADLDRVIRLTPDHFGPVLTRARFYANQRNWPLALSDYTRAIEISPQNWSAIDERAKVYRHLKRMDLAEKDETKKRSLSRPGVDKIPDTKGLSRKQAGYDLGRYYRRHNQIPQAIKEFTKGVMADPEDHLIYPLRGECYELLGDNKSALKDYSKYIDLFPNAIDGYLLRAALYRKMGRLDLAKKDLETREAIRSGELSYSGTISYHTKRLREHPEDRTSYISRGLLFKGKHKYHEAIADLTKALSMNPEDSARSGYTMEHIHFERANCYENVGDYSHAIADYNSILKFDNEAEDAFLYRGNCNAKLGLWEKAVQDYTLCIKHNGDPAPTPFNLRAKAYEKLGKADLAKRDYQKAKELQ